MTFREHSCGVASSFLQSVVVFDDLARLEDPRLRDVENAPPAESDEEGTPSEFGTTPGELVPPPESKTLPSGEAGVDVKRLSDAFAEKGLICGFLKPNPEEAESEGHLLLEAARRADIVVLDWVIERDEGETARGLLSAILEADRKQEEQRLRLVVVYTSQSDLNSIVTDLSKTLEEATSETPERGDFVLTAGSARVVVLAKETSAAVGEAAARRLPEEDLPQRLIEEFADFTMGLVPNVVLAGLAAVRSDTHRVLGVLDSRLDPAYVGQRLLLRDPAEAEEQLVELVASELRSVMEDRTIGAHADAAAVEEWVELQMAGGELALWQEIEQAEAEKQSKALLAHGIDGTTQPVADFRSRAGLKKKELHVHAARVFARDPERGDAANDDLAMRFALRTHYSHPDRVLQLGTVVRSGSEYILCVQPTCDSLRIDGERDFPFLPLVEQTDHFDLVLREEGKRLTLCVERKPYHIRLLRFPADEPKRCVVAAADGGEYF